MEQYAGPEAIPLKKHFFLFVFAITYVLMKCYKQCKILYALRKIRIHFCFLKVETGSLFEIIRIRFFSRNSSGLLFFYPDPKHCMQYLLYSRKFSFWLNALELIVAAIVNVLFCESYLHTSKSEIRCCFNVLALKYSFIIA